MTVSKRYQVDKIYWRAYINEHEIRVPAILSHTEVELIAKGIRARYGIGLVSLARIWNWLAQDQRVEKVIDKVHLRRRVAFGAVDAAVKGGGNVIRRFPNIGEL
jgi:hypothetical protein